MFADTRAPACVATAIALLALAGCASTPKRTAAASQAREEAVVVRSADPQDYRFHMEQDGRKMSADEFDAWMKARGIRIATGAPAKAPAATARARK
jgi:hypothetical protein